MIGFSGGKCKGAAFLAPLGDYYSSDVRSGVVFRVRGAYFYVLEGISPVSFNVNSYVFSNGDCFDYGDSYKGYGFPILPNDPSVTGFDPDDYSPPFKIVKK